MKKLSISAFLLTAVGLALPCCPFKTTTANAQFTYVTNSGTITITGTSITYIGGIALTIPPMTNGFPVTSIRVGGISISSNMTMSVRS